MKSRRLILFSLYTLFYIIGVQSQNILTYSAHDLMEAWADSILTTLSPEERLGQLIIPIVGNSDTPEQRAIIRNDIEKYHVGGLLFSKGTLSSQESLTIYGQSISPKVPLMITTDSEWGLFMRLTDAVRFPKNMTLGCINHTYKANGVNMRDSLMYEYGFEIGKQCRSLGITVNFAPVLDINSNPKNPVIGNRSFGDDMANVASAALSYSSGVEDAGVLAVGKHFPGHGDTDKDSHKTLPLLTHDKDRMESFEMRPFYEFSKAGFGGIMVGHLEVPSIEPTAGMPSSASKNIITGYIRNKFRFNGLVFTDGLAMEGARKHPDFCVKSLQAGVDILLDPIPLADQWKKLRIALNNGSLSQELIDQKCKRVLMFKYALNCGILPDISTIDTEKAQRLSKELYQASLVLLKHEKSFDESTIIEVPNAKSATITQVNQKCNASKKPVTLVFYTSPYNIAHYKDAVKKASSVIVAHEDFSYAHEAVRNVLEGKANIDGQLCVEIPGLYKRGEGLVITNIQEPEPAASNLSDSVTEQPVIPEISNDALLEIDSLVNEGLQKGAFPGCQVLIAKDGEIVYNKAFGWYDDTRQKKVTNSSIYDLASVSKAAATVPALMIAIDEYGISINDKISKHVAALKGTDKQNLTIKQALFHETGMREGYPFYGMTIDSASVNGRLYSGKKDATYCILQDRNTWFNKNLKWNSQYISEKQDEHHQLQIADRMFITQSFRDEIISKTISLPLKNVGRYRYSCLNFVMLRCLIETKTKTSLDKYLQAKLFEPLGLTSCTYNPHQNQSIDLSLVVPTEDDQALRRQLLHGYVHDEIAAWSGGVEGNAGLFSNATDLAKILQLMLDQGEYEGKQIISKATCQLFTTTKSPKTRRGLGFDKPDMKNPAKSPCAEEVPGSVYGHTGFTGTCFWVDPTNRIIYIFLCNRVTPSRTNRMLMSESYRTRIQSIIYKKLVAAKQ